MLLASGALLAAVPGAAQVPQPDPAVTNTVHCPYDMMTSDDREMALLLYEREAMAGGPRSESQNLTVIDRLVTEAQAKCAAPLRWTSARTIAAKAYTMNALMREGVSQALDSKAHTTAPIAAYYNAHRDELTGQSLLSGAMAEHLQAYLVVLGWDKLDQATLGVGVFYLQALITAQRSESAFAAAPLGTTALLSKPKLKRPHQRSRAMTKKRGKP